jgi:DNA-binding IclR family transcriptional regulator
VRALVGADRSNFRRAVRTLQLRGLLEESEDGRRVRLTLTGALAASSLA